MLRTSLSASLAPSARRWRTPREHAALRYALTSSYASLRFMRPPSYSAMVSDRYGSTIAASRRAWRLMWRPKNCCSWRCCRFCHTTVHSTAIRLSTTPEFSPPHTSAIADPDPSFLFDYYKKDAHPHTHSRTPPMVSRSTCAGSQQLVLYL
uniref:Uncharacterized protein n=1 Tax=Arundo donax TaxID=35708 RepID=A0A0A9DFF6_ARUDO